MCLGKLKSNWIWRPTRTEAAVRRVHASLGTVTARSAAPGPVVKGVTSPREGAQQAAAPAPSTRDHSGRHLPSAAEPLARKISNLNKCQLTREHWGQPFKDFHICLQWMQSPEFLGHRLTAWNPKEHQASSRFLTTQTKLLQEYTCGIQGESQGHPRKVSKESHKQREDKETIPKWKERRKHQKEC